jgi:hypothetical protein
LARSKSINDFAVVAEVGHLVIRVGSANGESSGLGSGRRVLSILTLVSGSDSEEKAGANSLSGSTVDSSRPGATKRHVGDSTLGAVARAVVVGGEVDTGDYTRVGARTISSKDLDSVQLGLLGYSVGLSAHSTSNVSSVTVAIIVFAIIGVVGGELGT